MNSKLLSRVALPVQSTAYGMEMHAGMLSLAARRVGESKRTGAHREFPGARWPVLGLPHQICRPRHRNREKTEELRRKQDRYC